MPHHIDWVRGLLSDGSALCRSPRIPRLGERVTLRLRAFADAPIRQVWLWTRPDNREVTLPARKRSTGGPFVFWEGDLRLDQPDLAFHFVLSTEEGMAYFTTRGLEFLPPPADHDFHLLAMDDRPDWVEEAVFYQIFPDRFRKGDPGCDVPDGAWSYRGYSTRAMAWDERPLEYDEGGCLDHFGGDLDGIRQGLDHLEDLGVNALYLNPIFRGLTHHKYDCIDYGAVDPCFGGDGALARLVEACHERNMRVMLDISVNHVGTAHAWFDREGIFGGAGAFHDPEGPLGELFLRDPLGPSRRKDPFLRWLGVDDLVSLDYGNESLRNRIYAAPDAILRRWLRPPFSIDGWRFDVAFMMARHGVADHHEEVWRAIRQACKAERRDAYLISEDWCDATAFLRGDMFDGTMNYFGLARPLRQWCGQMDHFAAKLGTDLPRRPFGGAELDEALSRNLARLPHALHDLQFNLVDSHDWARLHHLPGVDRELLLGALVLLFAFPGAPSIYYGDEVGIDGHPRTNEGCRFPFPWDEARWDGELLARYRLLARLRRRSSALARGSYLPLLAEEDLFAFARFDAREIVVAVMGRDGAPRCVELPVLLAGAPDGTPFSDLVSGRSTTVSEGRIVAELAPRGHALWRAELAGA